MNTKLLEIAKESGFCIVENGICALDIVIDKELTKFAELILADHINDTKKMFVPDGYQLVPIEPTFEQIKAGHDAWREYNIKRSSTLYTAMVKAAPKDKQS